MKRVRAWFQLRALHLVGVWHDIRDELSARRSAWSATLRAVARKPALLLALPLIYVLPAASEDRRLVTSTRLGIAPLQTDGPQALRLAQLLADEHQGTVVVMDAMPLDRDLTEE